MVAALAVSGSSCRATRIPPHLGSRQRVVLVSKRAGLVVVLGFQVGALVLAAD